MEGFSGLLCTGHIVCQRDSAYDNSGSNSHPYSRRTAQYGHEPFEPTTRLANRCGKLADSGRSCTDCFCDLPQHQKNGSDRSCVRRKLYDLYPLGFVHLKELHKQFAGTVNQVLYCGIQIIANLLTKEQGCIFKVLQLALCGGIPFASLGRQSGILFPGTISCFLGFAEKFGGIGRAQQRIAQTYFHNTDFLQCGNSRFAFIIQLGQAHDECLKRSCRIAVPQRLELLCRHAGYLGEVIQSLPACCGGYLHLNQRF